MDGIIGGSRLRYDPEPDAHFGRLRLVLDDIVRRDIGHVVFGGDIGAGDTVDRFFAVLSAYPVTTSFVLGNHDGYGDIARQGHAGATPVAGRLCSAQQDGAWTRIVIDTSDNTVGNAQLAWLDAELRGAGPVMLFSHHPVLEIDTPIERAGAALRDRAGLKAVLLAAGREVTIFCGHYHMIDDAREGTIRQHVSPAVSYQIVKGADGVQVDRSTFGYRVIEISDAGIRTQPVLLTEARCGSPGPAKPESKDVW